MLSQIILSTAKSKSNNFLYGIVVLLIFVFNGNTATEKMAGGVGQWLLRATKWPRHPPPPPPLFQCFKQTLMHRVPCDSGSQIIQPRHGIKFS